MSSFDEMLITLYGSEALHNQKVRYEKTEKEFASLYGKHDNIQMFSAPGRTEIGGNHTDHNRGCVLAASVDLDVIACVVPTDNTIISITSEGFPRDDIDISDLSVQHNEINTSAALIRGVAAGFEKHGYKIGGFNAYTTSNVLKGSGISSSAAFEVLVANILSSLYNDGKVCSVEIAQIAQFAENQYFGKPSGLLDQMASSVGGFITVDFKDVKEPKIEEIKYDFAESGYSLCIVDTKGNHANLTHEYTAIPQEMKSVAELFGKNELRDMNREMLWDSITEARTKCGDRAIARAFHFFDENDRVQREAEALKSGDIDTFLKNVTASGNSSYKFLQNIFSSADPREEGVVLGLYTAERILNGRGACRVHGGGFAGTIQAFVPNDLLDKFISEMEYLFGKRSCYKLYIRPVGGTKVK